MRFAVHKLIVCSGSKRLKDMVQHEAIRKKAHDAVDISMDPYVMRHVIYFLYHAKLNIGCVSVSESAWISKPELPRTGTSSNVEIDEVEQQKHLVEVFYELYYAGEHFELPSLQVAVLKAFSCRAKEYPISIAATTASQLSRIIDTSFSEFEEKGDKFNIALIDALAVQHEKILLHPCLTMSIFGEEAPSTLFAKAMQALMDRKDNIMASAHHQGDLSREC